MLLRINSTQALRTDTPNKKIPADGSAFLAEKTRTPPRIFLWWCFCRCELTKGSLPEGAFGLCAPKVCLLFLTSTAFVDTKAKIFKFQLFDSIFSAYKYLSYGAVVSFFRYPHLHISSITLLAVVYPIFKERCKIDVDMYFLF